MTFTLDWADAEVHMDEMRIKFRSVFVFSVVMVLIAAWLAKGLFAVAAVMLCVVGYRFVLAMRLAAEEIRQIQGEERPDLYRHGSARQHSWTRDR